MSWITVICSRNAVLNKLPDINLPNEPEVLLKDILTK